MSIKNSISKRFTAMLLMVVMILAMIPFPSTAATKWNLEGWRTTNPITWTSGLVAEYYEGDYVPMRLEALSFDTIDGEIIVEYDYKDSDGHIGFDDSKNWFIGPVEGKKIEIDDVSKWYTPGANTFTVSTPSAIEVSNGKVVRYKISISSEIISDLQEKGEWTLYWEAHLSKTGTFNSIEPGNVVYGSSYWNGASLHVRTRGVTGNQDIPVKTPVRAGVNATISIEKSTNGTDADTPLEAVKINIGDSVKWTYTITNTSVVYLTDVVVTDDMGEIPVRVSEDVGNDQALSPGEVWTYEATGIANKGLYSNTGIVNAKYGESTISDSDPSHYYGIDAPEIQVIKTASPNTVPETGADVDFTFQITNTGESKVKLTSVIDDKLGAIYTWVDGDDEIWLNKGESHTIILTDQFISGNFGSDHINTVTATAYDEYGNSDTATDDETVTFIDVLPDISLEKSASRTSVLESGENVDFTFEVTNNGDEAVKITSVNDDKLGTIYSWSIGDEEIWLNEGESHTFTSNNNFISGTVGSDHVNTATAIAFDDDGNSDTASDSATVKFTKTPPTVGEVKITKDITAIENATLPGGDYAFEITLTGTSEGASYPNGLTKTFTADGQQLTWDNLLPGTYKISEENPGSDWNVTYSTESVSILAGDSKSATVTNTYNYIPPAKGSITITKNVDAIVGAQAPAGPYAFEITLTGTSEGASYPSGSTKTFTSNGQQLTWENLLPGTYAISEKDPGTVWNVTYSTESISILAGDSKSATVTNTYNYIPPAKGSITITKNVEAIEGAQAPDGPYEFEITLTGISEGASYPSGSTKTFTTDGQQLTWDNLLSGTYTISEKDPGSRWDVTYSQTQINIAAGDSKTATVTNTYNFIPTTDNPLLSLVKSGTWIDANDNGYANVGEQIQYTFTVTNIGNVRLTNVHVTDPKVEVIGEPVTLEVEGEIVFTGVYTLTQADLNAKLVDNTATAHSNEADDVNDDARVTLRIYTPPTTTTTTRRTPDPDPGNIEIFKFLDSNGNGSKDSDEFPFENIVFQLYDEDQDLIDTGSTDDEGMLTFRNLDAGTYYIKEARNDYSITTGGFDEDGFYEVDVDEDETVEIEVGNYREVVVPEEPPLAPPVIEEVEEEAPPLAVPVLPQTGEIPPYFAYGFGSLLVLAGAFMKRKF